MFTTHLFATCAFLVGLLFGSFLNVCIARLPFGDSIVKPRSQCPNCQHPVRWYDNIPVVSWLILRARCRDCAQTISWQYPVVELAMGLWFAKVAGLTSWVFYRDPSSDIQFGLEQVGSGTIQGFALAILGFLLLGLIVMDWQTHRLPDAFTLTGIAIGFFLICIQAVFLGPTEDQIMLKHKAPITAAMSVEKGNLFLTGPETLIGGRLVAILGAAALLLVVRWTYRKIRKRDGMGLGDVKLLAMIAAFLGFWPAMLALFAGVLTASVYGGTLLVREKAHAATRLPFGSFLAAGGLLSALFGSVLIDKYTSLFR